MNVEKPLSPLEKGKKKVFPRKNEKMRERSAGTLDLIVTTPWMSTMMLVMALKRASHKQQIQEVDLLLNFHLVLKIPRVQGEVRHRDQPQGLIVEDPVHHEREVLLMTTGVGLLDAAVHLIEVEDRTGTAGLHAAAVARPKVVVHLGVAVVHLDAAVVHLGVAVAHLVVAVAHLVVAVAHLVVADSRLDTIVRLGEVTLCDEVDPEVLPVVAGLHLDDGHIEIQGDPQVLQQNGTNVLGVAVLFEDLQLPHPQGEERDHEALRKID